MILQATMDVQIVSALPISKGTNMAKNPNSFLRKVVEAYRSLGTGFPAFPIMTK